MDPFTFDPELQVLICRGCGYAVRQGHVRTHLLRQHPNLGPQVRTITLATQEVDGLVGEAEGRLPPMFHSAHLALRPPREGFRCRLGVRTCTHVGGSVKSMKEHGRKVHQWTERRRRGKPSRGAVPQRGADGQAPWEAVRFQQVFPSGPGSHFIEVGPDQEGPSSLLTTTTTVFSEIDRLRTEAQQASWRTVQPASCGEVSPWLERTRWAAYLAGIERATLLALLEDPDPVRNPSESRIRTTVLELLKYCERSSTTSAGIFVRLGAVQSSSGRSQRQQPLVPYVHARDLAKSSRLWVQIVLFFVRVGCEPGPLHPQYQLTQDQRHHLESLCWLAGRTDRDEGVPSDDDDDSEDGANADEAGITPKVRGGNGFTPLYAACHQFCLALLRHAVRTNEYESPFVCVLAVLGVTEDGWKGPHQYPSLLSALMKTSRYMFVQDAMDRTASEPDSPSTLKLLRQDVTRYMFRGTFTPFDWMYELRAYGMKAAFSTNQEGLVEWDGETLLYGQLQFSMDDFRAFVHGLHHAVRALLETELLLARTARLDSPAVLLAPLRDDPRQASAGWCFLQDRRNQFPVEGDRWLWQQVQTHPLLRTKFFPPERSDAESWPPGVQAYFSSLAEFRTKLLLLVHLTAGQPARGTELLSVRFRNTTEGGYRNIFLESGLLNITTLWHKGYTITGNTKPINRFLPSEISTDVVRYLWLVQPFIERLELYYCRRAQLSAFLWPPEPGTTKPRGTEDVRRTLQHESYIGLGQILNVQQYRHIAIAISRKFLPRQLQFQEDKDRTAEAEEDNILDLQAGHTSAVAASTYARGLHERSQETFTVRQQYRHASLLWHSFLGFTSVRDEELAPSGTKHHLPFRDQLEQDAQQRQKRLRTIDVHEQLRRVIGPPAQFRPGQEAVVRAVLTGQSPILAVLPTGGGKSLLFQLPASYDQRGTTVLIVPLVALRQQMMARCASYGIYAREWDPRQPPDQAQLVIATPEAATSTAFGSFLNRLRTSHRLDRIVFDECHLLLPSDGRFRPAFLQLRTLLLHRTQLLFLSATLPPTCEPELWSQLHLTKSQPVCFRTTTVRPNISYRVMLAKGTTEHPQLLRRLIKAAGPGQVIVYGRTVANVMSLAAALGCGHYTAGSKEKAQQLQEFLLGTQRTIVATTALGLGVDVPNVSLVVHCGLPYSLIDFSQESGRAGRNGALSQSIIVRDEGPLLDTVEGELRRYLLTGPGECRRQVLDGYLDGSTGRTKCVPPESLCDLCERPAPRPAPKVVEPSPPTARPQTRSPPVPPTSSFVREGQRREGLLVDRVERRLQQLNGCCFRCLNQPGTIVAHDDLTFHPPDTYARAYDQMAQQIRTTIRFDRFAGCFSCGLPQRICAKWEATEGSGARPVPGGECQFPYVLSQGLAGILVPCSARQGPQEKLRGRAQAALGGDRTTAGFVRFCGRKTRIAVLETNEGVRMLLDYYQLEKVG
jgi:superfamily II DNA or RNA helicase